MLKIQASLRESTKAVVDTLGANITHPEVDTSTAEFQRLQIKVPTADSVTGTVVTAGRRLKGSGYDGFNVRTNRNLSLAAAGGKAESTMTIQSEGVVHVQSTKDSLVTVSAAPTVVASKSAVNVMGDGAVVISSGARPTQLYATAYSELTPAVLEPLDEFETYATALKDGWKKTSDDLKETCDARDTLEKDVLPAMPVPLAAPQAQMLTTNVALDAIKESNAPGTDKKAGKGAVAIHGVGGLLLDTPAAGNVHAATALALSSKHPMIVGSEDVDVHAAKNTTVAAGEHVRVLSGKDVHVVSKDDKVHIASRHGDGVEVRGKTVKLGLASPGGYPQDPTDFVYSRALKHVSLMTSEDPDGSVTTPGVFLKSHEEVMATGAKKVTLEIANKPVQIILQDSGNQIEIKAITASITLDPSGGVVLKHTVGSCEIKNDKVTVKSGGSQVEVSAGGVKVAGPSIKLG